MKHPRSDVAIVEQPENSTNKIKQNEIDNKRSLRSRTRQETYKQTKHEVLSTPSAKHKRHSNFKSCLEFQSLEDTSKVPVSICDISPRSLPTVILKRALSIGELDDESWLSSSLIDLFFAKFAKVYNNCRFLSTDFAPHLALSNADLDKLTDINGRLIDYKDVRKSIMFIINSNNIHWNLVRIVRHPVPELQLFEPMGLPYQRRGGGLNYRRMPRPIVAWLDKYCSLINGKSWITASKSAIPTPHQMTSFDCGVACLLYAEKCAQGQSKDVINAETTQQNITDYRSLLQDYLREND